MFTITSELEDAKVEGKECIAKQTPQGAPPLESFVHAHAYTQYTSVVSILPHIVKKTNREACL